MSALSDTADEYLELRRSFGHDLAEAHRLLPRFVAYLDSVGEPTVTVPQHCPGHRPRTYHLPALFGLAG